MKFSIDNPFFDVMGHIADLVVLNLLFLLTCVPLFTIGASVRALYEVLGRVQKGTEGTLYRTYFGTFAHEIRRTVKSSLVLLGIGVLLSFDLYFSVTQMPDSAGHILLPVLGALMVLYLMTATWVFVPDDANENGSEWHAMPTRTVLNGTFMRSVRHFPQTLLMIAVELVPVLVWQISFRWFCAFMLPVMAVIWFSVSGLLNLKIARMGEGSADKREKKRKEADISESRDDYI